MKSVTKTIVLAFAVVHIFISAGVAAAQSMKVACVGDSITAPPTGWCGYLGTKLGSGYTAQTFGVSGTTLLKNVGQPAYSSSNQYKPSHDFAPNIVVIMLGTNDSAPRNWDAGKDHFVKDYEELIDSYTSLASKPQVFLNTAPPASDDNVFTISGTNIEKEVNPLIKQVAMEKMVPLVDVWAAFGGDVSKLGGSDGVHPGTAGAMLIADTVYTAIKSPNIPGASAGTGGSAGGGGSANAGAGGGGAGSSANAGGASGGSANAGGAGGSANAGGAGGSAIIAGASGGKAGGGANTGASGNTGSGASGSASLAGAGGNASAAGNSSTVNGIGAAGMSVPAANAPESSDGGCHSAGGSSTNNGVTAALLLLLGIAIRSRKRNVRRAVVQLSVVVSISISAGIANAQTKVACIGDSITALPSSWCGDLSTKLGAGYTVSNFGVSGTNLAKSVAQPYWSSAQYTPSHTFAPDIVIIMLGTNDAIPATWSGGMSHFVKDYEELIDTYTSLASKPKIYMIIPTPIGTSPFGHDGNLLATEVIPAIKQVAMEKMVPTADAFTAFGGTMFDPGLYGAMDQVHPNAKGQQIICDAVYAVLMSMGGPGGTAGAGGSAGSGGSAAAGSGGMATAGGMAMAGSSANAGSAGMATAGGSATAGGAGTMSAIGAGGGGANTAGITGSANAGGRASAAGSTSLAGTSGSAIAGNSSTANGIGVAGSAPVVTAPESSDGGCRTAGNAAGSSAPTATLLLLLGMMIRRRGTRRARLCIVTLTAAGLALGCSDDESRAGAASAGSSGSTGTTTGPTLGSSGVGAPAAAGSGAGAGRSGLTGGVAGSPVSAGTMGSGTPSSAAGAKAMTPGTAGAVAAAGSGGAAPMPAAGTTGQTTNGQAGAPAGSGTCTASTAASSTATGSGPHKVVVETNSDPGIVEGTIFRPMDLKGAEKYPIFVWGEGGCQQNGLSNAAVMGEIASHGYFVIADGKPNGTGMRSMGSDTASMGKPLLAYIDWAIAENDKPCSAYYQSLDTQKIASNGFSCGGLMAEGTAGDPRITTWGLNSSGLFAADQAFYKTVHTPVLIVLGGSADIAYENGERDYDNISVLGQPIMLFSVALNHGGDLYNGQGDFAKIDVAWLNWWLKGDEGATGKGVLVGSSCKYCSDTAWEVKSKNVP